MKPNSLKKTIGHNPINMNRQNLHIAVLYERVEQAALALMLMGITVLRIELEGPHPLIDVMPTAHCKKLDSYQFATINKGAGRGHIMRARVNGCIVQWQSVYDIH